MLSNEIAKALPNQCHLAARMEVDDHMMHRGIPQDYITKQLAHTLGRHLGEKSSTFIKREDPCNPWDAPRPGHPYRPYGCTTYTAEVFVFSEAELVDFARKMQLLGTQAQVETMVGVEVALKVGSVKTELKKSLKKQIDKALE